ncbi:hypothetical protein D9757_013173 [Collybiopsis confluens]|uniref:Uncharacterized protein n=1 Tax=Collybiopsis confluens TaxID=2823264 RepID=A0A8H5FYA4_9AGAR|nr:hypothetical protein D9757_013173 [Collybiopsis confluens]
MFLKSQLPIERHFQQYAPSPYSQYQPGPSCLPTPLKVLVCVLVGNLFALPFTERALISFYKLMQPGPFLPLLPRVTRIGVSDCLAVLFVLNKGGRRAYSVLRWPDVQVFQTPLCRFPRQLSRPPIFRLLSSRWMHVHPHRDRYVIRVIKFKPGYQQGTRGLSMAIQMFALQTIAESGLESVHPKFNSVWEYVGILARARRNWAIWIWMVEGYFFVYTRRCALPTIQTLLPHDLKVNLLGYYALACVFIDLFPLTKGLILIDELALGFYCCAVLSVVRSEWISGL